jgi:hypothetical protein
MQCNSVGQCSVMLSAFELQQGEMLSLYATLAMSAPVQSNLIGRHGSVPQAFDNDSSFLPPALTSLNCDGRFCPQCFFGRTAAPIPAPVQQDFVGQRRLVLALTTCGLPY